MQKGITKNISDILNRYLHTYQVLSVLLTAVAVVLVIIFKPVHQPFWPFTVWDIVILLVSLFLVSLFIERAVEVIMIVWRNRDKQKFLTEINAVKKMFKLKTQQKQDIMAAADIAKNAIAVAKAARVGKNAVAIAEDLMQVVKEAKTADDAALSDAQRQMEMTKQLEEYSAQTKTLAMLTAFALGIAISALGVRALQPLVDPAVFKSLGTWQRALFIGADTLVTGALLGGGSDGIHKILDLFTSTAQQYLDKIKKGE
ncbi:MAG: hypothetical protein WBB67_09085 [bacterium]